MGQPFAGPYNFKYHPWCRAMHDCEADMMVGQKGAQLGFTEVALNKAFKAIDIDGVSVLYVLPASKPDASDFSTSRFDPALELSPHLRNMFSNVKNIGHKRAGNANLFIRGSRSRSQLKSLPVGVVVLDELDEMSQENVPLVFERMAGQLQKHAFLLSTPTIDHFGINTWYRQSTQNHFFFKCPSCSKLTELLFPECLVITADDWNQPSIKESHLICKECKNIIPHKSKYEAMGKGIWVPQYTDREIEGFHVSQLYSMTVAPHELAASYLKSQHNPAEEQEFYNSKLGITHIVEGARINDDDIHNCIGMHKKVLTTSPNSFVTIGIDVGKWLHYEIDQWFFDDISNPDINLMARCKVIREGKVVDFEELDALMRDFAVNFCVIDANPERRKALEFAQRFYGFVKMCFYGRGVTGKTIHLHDEEQHTMLVDRTSWLDLSLGRFRSKRITLPVDVSTEYKNNLKALVRIYDTDGDGNPVGKYVKGSEQDHFAHARNYSEIALKLGASFAVSRNISGNIL